jgi:hypothetical protein
VVRDRPRDVRVPSLRNIGAPYYDGMKPRRPNIDPSINAEAEEESVVSNQNRPMVNSLKDIALSAKRPTF